MRAQHQSDFDAFVTAIRRLGHADFYTACGASTGPSTTGETGRWAGRWRKGGDESRARGCAGAVEGGAEVLTGARRPWVRVGESSALAKSRRSQTSAILRLSYRGALHSVDRDGSG